MAAAALGPGWWPASTFLLHLLLTLYLTARAGGDNVTSCTPPVEGSVSRVGAGTRCGPGELCVLVLLPFQRGGYFFPFGAEMCGAAVLKALEDVRTSQLLPGLTLHADFANSACDTLLGFGEAHERLGTGFYSAVLGPVCSQVCRHVGRLAAYLELPAFTGVCQGTEMDNKAEFKTLTRFLATFEMTGRAVSRFVMSFGWRRVGIIAQTGTDIIWLLTKNGIHSAMEQLNIHIASSLIVQTEDQLEATLLETASLSRVIILLTFGKTFRHLMAIAHKHDMHKGDYVFVSVPYYKQRKVFGDFSWKHNDGLDDTIREVYPAVFFLWYFTRDKSDEYQVFEEYVKRRSLTEFNYTYGDDEEVPYPAANLYEAVTLYAAAANETLEEGGSLKDGLLLSQRLWNRSFPSITGGVSLNANGDRDQAYKVTHLQMLATGDVQEVAAIYSSNQSVVLLTSQLVWPGGRTSPPPDSPLCGYDGEFCREDPLAALKRTVGIFAGVLVGMLIVSTIVVFGFYRRLKLDREIADMKWKVDIKDIIFKKGSRSMMSRASINTHGTVAQRFTRTGQFKGIRIALKPIEHLKEVNLNDKAFLLEMKQLQDLNHTNVLRLIGATVEPDNIYLLSEYCVKGSLQDVLENDDITLDWDFKTSLLADILEGMQFLHQSFLHCHGNLKSSNCLVDGRFVVRLSDFGLHTWHNNPDKQAKDFLWTAPELLSIVGDTYRGTDKGDIYSLGVIMHEMVAREGTFYIGENNTLTPQEIITKVQTGATPPLRPMVDQLDCPAELVQMMQRCWAQLPSNRPSLSEVKAGLGKLSSSKSKNMSILDKLLHRMEQYANNLEELVEERTGNYLEEKKKAEDLLHRLLPPSIANEIQTSGKVDPVSYNQVTIYFSDIVEFTPLCSNSTPLEVVDFLNDLYTLFDEIIARFDVYKVETIGDAYMAVSGLPRPNDNHSAEIALMSLSLISAMSTYHIRHRPDQRLKLRIGLHSGPCVAGVVGRTMPRYCLFGDTVNTASRMESSGEAFKIHISCDTKSYLDLHEGFVLEARGDNFIKGKGNMATYWLIEGPTDARRV